METTTTETTTFSTIVSEAAEQWRQTILGDEYARRNLMQRIMRPSVIHRVYADALLVMPQPRVNRRVAVAVESR